MSTTAPVFADFGPMVASTDVDDAVLATLETWVPSYMAHFEDARGLERGFLARPKTYASVVESTEFLDATLPAVFIMTARTEQTPQIYADGGYSVLWLVATSCVVRGRNAFESRRNASWTDAVIRKILVDQPGLGGFANGVRWIGGAQAQPLPDQTKQERYLAEGASEYDVRVDDVVRPGISPQLADGTPAPDPAAPSPPATEYHDLPVPATVIPATFNATGGS